MTLFINMDGAAMTALARLPPNVVRIQIPTSTPCGGGVSHWTKKWICTNFLLANMSQKCKPWSKYGGKDGKCHICIPNNGECKYLGKWGICRLCSRFTPQFFYFAAYVPEANLFKSIFPSSVLRGEVFPRVIRFSSLPP